MCIKVVKSICFKEQKYHHPKENQTKPKNLFKDTVGSSENESLSWKVTDLVSWTNIPGSIRGQMRRHDRDRKHQANCQTVASSINGIL